MANINEPAGKTQLKVKISQLLQKNRVPLLSITGVVVAALVILGVYFSLVEKRIARGIEKMESVIQIYEEEWMGASEEERTAIRETLDAEIELLIEEYPKDFPGQKALFMKAEIAAQSESFETASATYAELARTFPESYLAPVSLAQAAATAEEAGMNDKAREYLTELVDKYQENKEELYRGLFNLARLQEQAGLTEEAITNYSQILDLGASAGWAGLAQTRLIQLGAE